jgi:hypothetical protein
MTRNEYAEACAARVQGCWYCGWTGCMLTHKADPLSAAKHPERDPYADARQPATGILKNSRPNHAAQSRQVHGS